MDWTMIGALGELAGAAVVGVTLIYLARQMRLSNRLAQADARRTASVNWSANLMQAMAVPEFRSGFAKVMGPSRAVPKDLDGDERAAVAFFYTAGLLIYEQMFREAHLGIIPPEALDDDDPVLYRAPYFQALWPKLRDNHSAEFATYIDRRYVVAERAAREERSTDE